tara:strand:- start:2951 stop:3253 length:303 start_codon:yes stop_codon:yes gene_type:complete
MKETLAFVIKNTLSHPLMDGCDYIILELFTHSGDTLRQYILDGEGHIWLPNVEGCAVAASPFGKLLFLLYGKKTPQEQIDAALRMLPEDAKVMYLPAERR